MMQPSKGYPIAPPFSRNINISHFASHVSPGHKLHEMDDLRDPVTTDLYHYLKPHMKNINPLLNQFFFFNISQNEFFCRDLQRMFTVK